MTITTFHEASTHWDVLRHLLIHLEHRTLVYERHVRMTVDRKGGASGRGSIFEWRELPCFLPHLLLFFWVLFIIIVVFMIA